MPIVSNRIVDFLRLQLNLFIAEQGIGQEAETVLFENIGTRDIQSFFNACQELISLSFGINFPPAKEACLEKLSLDDGNLRSNLPSLEALFFELYDISFSEKEFPKQDAFYASFYTLEKDLDKVPSYEPFQLDNWDSKNNGIFRYLSNQSDLKKHPARMGLLHAFSRWNGVEKDDWSEISFGESLELLCHLIHSDIDYSGHLSYPYPKKQAQKMAAAFLSFLPTSGVYFYSDVKDCSDPYHHPGQSTSYSHGCIAGFKSIAWLAITKDFVVSVEKNWDFWSE